jgi:phage terminase large subunit
VKKYYPIINNESRYFIVTGGRGSGKSFAVSSLLLAMISKEQGHTILFTRYTMTSAHISIIPEFMEKIEILGAFDLFHITKDEIINKETGSKILFRGIKTSSGDQTANLKSLQGVTCWVLDEAEELTDEDTFDKIDLSVRAKGKQNRVVLILNPTTKEHFIYQRFFEGKGVESGSNLTKDDTTYIHTTYLDNIDNLSESYLRQIENIRTRRPERFKHQILGGWLDKAEGVIFSNWSIGEFQEVTTSVYGQDFGFSNDPTTLVQTSIDKVNKIVYIKLHLYQAGLHTSEIYNINKRVCDNALIVADSAEPRLISELRGKGLNIVEAIKGQGSVTHGISILQDYDLVIDPESIDLHKELNNYCWLEKKSKTPIDDFNHAIDAIRYAVTYQLERPNKGVYHVY